MVINYKLATKIGQKFKKFSWVFEINIFKHFYVLINNPYLFTRG